MTDTTKTHDQAVPEPPAIWVPPKEPKRAALLGRPLETLNRWRKDLPLPVRRTVGWAKRALRPHPVWNHPEFQRYRARLHETQWWSRSQLEALQEEQLAALVQHAYEHVAYYRHSMDAIGLTPRDIHGLGDLPKLPILTKEAVRTHTRELLADNVDPKRLHFLTTGGSTGEPLGLYQDAETAFPREEAFRLRPWVWAGFSLGDRTATFKHDIDRLDRNGRPAYWDYATENNELHLSVTDVRDDNLLLYIKLLHDFRPQYLNSAPSCLEILSRYLERTMLHVPPVDAVFCESENLYAWQRTLIEHHLGGPVYAGYGHTERAVDAVECEHHTGYHVSMEYGILELVDQNDQPITEPGVVGRVVGTGFDTFCMPFIRYATDDLASFASGPCACGRQLVRVQNLHGRVGEFLIARSGNPVPFNAVYAGSHARAWQMIREVQYVQERKGLVTIRVVRAPGYSEQDVARTLEADLRARLREEEFAIQFAFVESVPRTARGKINLLEQKLPVYMGEAARALTECIGETGGGEHVG
ncbi:MAG: phenylacetate--CoA ligase family protein [Anaerolineae bacterium]